MKLIEGVLVILMILLGAVYFISFKPSVEDYTQCFNQAEERAKQMQEEVPKENPKRSYLCERSQQDLESLDTCLNQVEQSYPFAGIYLKVPKVQEILQQTLLQHKHYCPEYPVNNF